MTGELWSCLGYGLLPAVLMMAFHPVLMYLSRREPNVWSGYRTKRARASVRNWQFAQAACAGYMLWIGIVASAAVVLVFGAMFVSGVREVGVWQNVLTYLIVLMFCALLWMMARIERSIKKLEAAERGPVR